MFLIRGILIGSPQKNRTQRLILIGQVFQFKGFLYGGCTVPMSELKDKKEQKVKEIKNKIVLKGELYYLVK